ncbi:MAG: hypothetical protein IJY63_00715 [Clostridia bacterium]|nr:hypothetical protein [Clostridia bacterium]MBQ8876053.1 hypothetical protein [Clostridia bacterium]
MKCFVSQNLLVPFWSGFGSLTLLFLLCFVGVHAAKFAVRGWRLYDRSQPQNPTKNQEKPPAPQPTPVEPIYYIVEKKRRRSRPSYGEPKEIRFK